MRLLCFFAALAAAHAAPSPLLPRPRQIRYGAASIPLRSVSIRLAPGAAQEDRFAAKTLAACLGQPESGRSGTVIELKRTGPLGALPGVDEKAGPESREAYWLSVRPGGVEVRAASSAGLFYGVQTLCQLVEGTPPRLPEVEIHDWPSLAWRGTMVDMSHGGLPTVDEIERQIDLLARFKANQYYFYNEASIELDGYPLLNPEGRYTKAQVRRIIEYARERHIDTIPCLELYGHLHDLFRLERYSGLADFPHGGEFNPANPKVAALLADWVDQFARLFPSPLVHVGFDETWQIEQAAREQGPGMTPARLFTRQLGSVVKLFAAHGKRAMAWGDIIIKYPDTFADLPNGLIAVAWQYEPNGNFARWLKPLGQHHVPMVIATGVSNWREAAPDFDFTFGNIDNFLAAARPSAPLGMMNTLWADSGSQLQRLAWPAVVYGAAAAWQSAPMDRAAFFRDYARILYRGAAAGEVAAAFTSLNEAELELQKALGQSSFWAMWQTPFLPATLKRSAERREHLRQARLLAEDAQEHAHRAGGIPSVIVGSRIIDYAGQKFLYALEIYERWKQLSEGPLRRQDIWNKLESGIVYQSHSRLADLMDEASEIRNAYRAAWLAENTQYRLRAALGRWDAEYEYWRSMQIRMQTVLRNLGDKPVLPPLETLVGEIR